MLFRQNHFSMWNHSKRRSTGVSQRRADAVLFMLLVIAGKRCAPISTSDYGRWFEARSHLDIVSCSMATPAVVADHRKVAHLPACVLRFFLLFRFVRFV